MLQLFKRLLQNIYEKRRLIDEMSEGEEKEKELKRLWEEEQKILDADRSPDSPFGKYAFLPKAKKKETKEIKQEDPSKCSSCSSPCK